MSPFLEVETYPRGRRVLIVPVGLIFLVGPYGSMIAVGHKGFVQLLLTVVAIGICTALMGLGITVPRRRVVVDGGLREIKVSSTPPLPSFAQQIAIRSFDDVDEVRIEEVGDKRTADHGYRVMIDFHDGPPLDLHRHRNSDYAQDTIDHLVRLGLPGHSRAAAREAIASAPKPTTWL